MKSIHTKILSMVLSMAIAIPALASAKDYSYKADIFRQDFSDCISFEDTGLYGDITGTFDGSSQSPWYIEEDENGVKCLAADITSKSPKAYLAVGDESMENYTVTVSFVMSPENVNAKNGVSLYTRSKGIIHTYGSKSCSYFRHRFSNAANYNNYYCCWVKLNDGANESVYENNWFDRTSASALGYGTVQTITASAENTSEDGGSVSVKQTVTLNNTFSASKTKTYPSNSPILSGKAVMEFLEPDGGHVRVYSVAVTGNVLPKINLHGEDGGEPVLEEGKLITAETEISRNTAQETTPLLINASYEDGKLIDISADMTDFEGSNTAKLSADVKSPSENGCVSAVLWNGFLGDALSEGQAAGSLDEKYSEKGMNFDNDETLHIYGNVSDITDNAETESVNILVLNPNTDADSLNTDKSTLINGICGVYGAKADENGNFGIYIKPNRADNSRYGEYKAYLRADDGNSKVYTAVLKNPALFGETIKEFNQKIFSSDEEIKKYIDEKAEILGLDITLLDKVKDKTAVYTALVKARPYDTDNPQISEIYKNAVMCVEFNEAEGENMLNFIEENAEILKLAEMKNYGEYSELSREEKIKLLQCLDKLKPAETLNGINECIDKSIILYIISDKNYTWNGFYEVLQKYRELLGLDFTRYNKLSEYYKKSVITSLQSKLSSMTETDEIKPEFERLVNAAPLDTPQTGGGSGGGGGGSSRPSVSSPASGSTIVNRFDNERASETPSEVLVSEMFSDLENYKWAKDSIEYLAEKEIVNGSDGKFNPQDNVTREQFIKMAVNAFGLETDGKSCTFKDVIQNEWYYPYISAAVSSGLINGIDSESFGVGQCVTRQQIAAVIYRYIEANKLKLPKSGTAKEFTDAEQISEYALSAVKALNEAGIINGDENACFNPFSSASRAETAVIVHRIILALENAERVTENTVSSNNSETDEMEEKETGEPVTDDAGQLLKDEDSE